MNAKPFDESRESQDVYCRDCENAHSCNVMLKDGEECGDRYVPVYQPLADGSVRLIIEPEDVPESVQHSDFGCVNCLWNGAECKGGFLYKPAEHEHDTSRRPAVPSCGAYVYYN